MDDLDFTFISKEGETQTRYELRAEFYRRNRFREYFWDGSSKLSASRPIAILSHERDIGESMQVLYPGGYYVTIEKGKSMLSGPHSGKLYLYHKDYPEGIWLGTKQFDGAYYDEKGIKRQLRKAIKTREFWMSVSSEDEEVVLSDPKEVVIELPEPPSQLPLRKRKNVVKMVCTKVHKCPSVWGGIWWIPPKCPICGAKRMTEAKMRKHFRLNHPKKSLEIWHSSALGTSWA